MINVYVIALVFGALCWTQAAAQGPASDFHLGQNTEMRGFRVPDFDDEGKLTSEILGEFARVRNQKIDITGLNIEFYSYVDDQRKVDMTVTAPRCDFDQKRGTAQSDSDVRIERENMVVTGIGFEFDSTKRRFRIFNQARVEATGARAMLPGLAGGAGNVPGKVDAADVAPTVITSRELTFDHEDLFALFEGDVLVVDARLEITSDKLTLRFNENSQAERVEAEGRVKLLQASMTARGERADYDVVSGVLTMEGLPNKVEVSGAKKLMKDNL